MSIAAHAQTGLRAPSPNAHQHKRVAEALADLDPDVGIRLGQVSCHPLVAKKPVSAVSIKVVMLRLGWRCTIEDRPGSVLGGIGPAFVWRCTALPYPQWRT